MNYVYAAEHRPLFLGRQGENEITTVRFPVAAFFPGLTEGQFELVHQRPNDSQAYVCSISVTDDFIEWIIYATDLEKVGSGIAQLTLVQDDTVGKSIIFTTEIRGALTEIGDSPSAYVNWSNPSPNITIDDLASLPPPEQETGVRYVYATEEKPVCLGRRGENEVTIVRFPWKDFFPEFARARFELVHQRYKDKNPYPCAIATNDTFIEWVIRLADVDVVGSGMAQLTAISDDSVSKSVLISTETLGSLGEAGEAPAAYKPWIDQVLGYAASAEGHAASAFDSAESAEGSANDAAESASSAAEAEARAIETADSIINIQSISNSEIEYMLTL